MGMPSSYTRVACIRGTCAGLSHGNARSECLTAPFCCPVLMPARNQVSLMLSLGVQLQFLSVLYSCLVLLVCRKACGDC